MTIICRTATAADSAAIVALVNDAFSIEKEMLTGERIGLSEVEERLQLGSFLVCDGKDGGLDGCVYVEPRGETGYLGLVSVAPTRQSLGLGRDLMAVAEERLRAAGCGSCQLWVLDFRQELTAWYQRRGYRVVRTEPFEAVNPNRKQLQPCHFKVMERDLTRVS